MTDAKPPEYNVTGQDYARREHFTYYPGPPIVDIHSHVSMTSAASKPTVRREALDRPAVPTRQP